MVPRYLGNTKTALTMIVVAHHTTCAYVRSEWHLYLSVPVVTVLLNARYQTRTEVAWRGRRVFGESIYVRAWVSCFQNMKRTTAITP